MDNRIRKLERAAADGNPGAFAALALEHKRLGSLEISVSFNGGFPNLCSGELAVTILGREIQFEKYCLSSGGSVWFDENWSEHVTSGPWRISDWPEELPEELRELVLDRVNVEIPHGCCGGCV